MKSEGKHSAKEDWEEVQEFVESAVLQPGSFPLVPPSVSIFPLVLGIEL